MFNVLIDDESVEFYELLPRLPSNPDIQHAVAADYWLLTGCYHQSTRFHQIGSTTHAALLEEQLARIAGASHSEQNLQN